MNYSINQINEIKKCEDPITGPEYFLTNYFSVQGITGSSRFIMHDYCKKYLDNVHKNQQSINLISRQLGKTTLIAGYALWMALFVPGSSIMIMSATFNMAKDAMQRVQFGYDNLPEFLKVAVVSRQTRQLSFAHDSIIIVRAITDNACRGLTLSLLLIDELAYANSNIATQMLSRVMPALAIGGKLAISSSFNLHSDAFGTLWNDATHNINKLSPFEAKWHDHPDRTVEWSIQQEKYIGRTVFRKEYMNQVLQEI